ncbi:hypothetical protein FLX27_26400 [Agrobacterium tumefaciens]|nr:hypothetical protein [Agrobacterium tumefaciens]TQN58201.1 hypothetical protein FLX27_26400 [Agrobacterium tumefaciens]
MSKNSRSRTKSKPDIKGTATVGLAQVPPPNTAARYLPLNEMQDEHFEFICIDIAEREPEVAQADLKRSRGVEQFGADVEGFSTEHVPVLVISAKRYQKVTPTTLKKWGTDFLDVYEGHWKGKGVKRFVIAATVEFNDDGLNEAIREEKQRFGAVGIAYEAWGLRQLTNKLRGLPRVVGNYMHPAWVPIICDPGTQSETTLSSRDDRAIANVVTRHAGADLADAVGMIKERYGREIGLQLEGALANLSEGRAKPLEALVARVREDLVTWDSLGGETKAKVLRSASALALRDQDIIRAKALRTEAALYHPAPDRSAAALLLVAEGDTDGALALLVEPRTAEENSIFAGVLIEEGKTEEARDFLLHSKGLEGDASERDRLLAYASSVERQDEAALAAIRKAEIAAPRRYAIQWAGALIRFNAALSPQLRFQGGSYPNPVGPAFVKEDDASRALLAEAAQMFARLADAVDVERQIEELEIWNFAALLCHGRRTADAEKAFAGIMTRPVPHPGAIAWAVHFGLSVKGDPVIKIYSNELSAGRGTSSQVVVSAFLMLHAGSSSRALNFLRKWRLAFDLPGDLELIDHWIVQVSEMQAARASGEDDGSSFQAALTAVYKKRDATKLVSLIDDGHLEADRLLAAFEALLAGRMWREANARRSLLSPFKTASSVEMMAVAACEAGEWGDCIQILEENVQLFANGSLPRKLKLLEADAKSLMGRPDLALKVIESLQAGEGDASGIAFRSAWLRLGLGDVAGAARQIKGRGIPSDIGVENILHIAGEFRHEDPELARSILEDVPWSKLEKRLINPALALAAELGLAEAQRALLPKVQALPQNQAKRWTVETIDEMLAWLEDNRKKQESVFEKLRTSWLNLEIPLHLLFDGKPIEWAGYFHRPVHRDAWGGKAGSFDAPLLLRSGHIRARQDGEALAATIAARGLIVDASALLLATKLGLLDEIDQLGARIMLAREVPEVLRSTETTLAQNFRPVSSAALSVEGLVRDGEISKVDAVQATSMSRLVLVGGTSSDTDVILPELLNALYGKGLDRDLGAAALARLDLTKVKTSKMSPTEQALLVSTHDLIQLSDMGLLTPILTFLPLHISESDADRMRQDIAEIQDGVRQAEMLTRLREHVSDRLTAGKWSLLPHLPRPKGDRELANSGPLLRSLVGILHYCESDDREAVWIEDRYLSRFGALSSSPAMDVTDIIAVLRARGRVDAKREQELMRRLEKAHYGFLLPRTGEFVDALLSAPVGKAGIVETPRLAELREVVAWQIEYGRHLKDVPHGGNVAAGSELLFLSKLMRLAGKVVALIWSKDIALKSKAAACTWAWQHLRLEQVDYLPLEDRAPAARQHFVDLQYAGLATVVFSIAGRSYRSIGRVRKQYLDWAFTTVLDDYAARRPAFDKVLVDLAAQFINLLFESGLEADEDDYPVKIAVARDYVGCFPKRIQTLLQGHALLSDKLTLRRTEIVTIGDMSFSAKSFFAAVKIAHEQGRATAPLRKTRRQARFAPLDPDKAGGAFGVTIADRKTTTSIADDTLALLLEAPEKRVEALKRHADWFDCTGSDLERTAREVGELATFDERRAELQRRQENTVVWRLDKLAADIHAGTASPNDLLAPSNPAALRRFLRIPDSGSGFSSLTDLAVAGFRALSPEVGALRALRRISALPVELPDDVNMAIAAEAKTMSLQDVFARTGPTPLAIVALWKALCENGLALPGFVLSDVLRNIEEFSELFVSVLQLTFRAAAQTPHWHSLDWERTALLWCHANSVVDVMLHQHVAIPETIKLLDMQFKARLDESFENAKLPGMRMRSPSNLRGEYFAAAASWHAWAATPDTGLDDASLAKLKAIVSRRVGRHDVPLSELLTDRSFKDVADTWLSRDVGHELQLLSVVEMPPPFELREAKLIAARIIPEIRSATYGEGEGVWNVLWFCETAELSRETLLAIRSLQTRDGLISLLKLEGRYVVSGMIFRAYVAGHLEDKKIFLDDLDVAAHEARKGLDARQRKVTLTVADTPQDRLFTSLVEAVWVFASLHAETFDDLGKEVRAGIAVIARQWSESRLACLDILDVFAKQLSPVGAAPIWDLINQLRRSETSP